MWFYNQQQHSTKNTNEKLQNLPSPPNNPSS